MKTFFCGFVMFKEVMNFIQQLSVTDQVTIGVAILTAIIVPLAVYLYKIFINPKESIFFNEIESHFLKLNPQLKPRNILSKDGKISFSKIMNAHKEMFQGTEFPAGILRDREVEILSREIAFPLSLEQGTHLISDRTTKTNLYTSTEVKKALKKAISMWNKYAPKKSRMNQKSKIELLSRFHTYFQAIHPFTDGNGRIGRFLLSEQCSYLFERIVEFSPNTQEYYEAISKAVRGNEIELQTIIVKEISKGISLT